MPTAKWFSLPVTLLLVVYLTNITNYSYNEAKSPIPSTSLKAWFTVCTLTTK